MTSRNRGRVKPKLRDFSRQQPTEEQNSAVWAALQDSPAIATAILGCATTERHLEELLRRRIFRRDDQTWEILTDANGPLATFYSKIEMGYALAIYGESIREGLYIIRSVRNAFAHSKILIDFEHELIVKELKSISSYKQKSGELRNQSIRLIKHKELPGRDTFLALVTVISTYFYRVENKHFKRQIQKHKKRNLGSEALISNALNYLLPSFLDDVQKESQQNFLQSFRLDHTAGPKKEVPQLKGLESLPEIANSFRNTDKKTGRL